MKEKESYYFEMMDGEGWMVRIEENEDHVIYRAAPYSFVRPVIVALSKTSQQPSIVYVAGTTLQLSSIEDLKKLKHLLPPEYIALLYAIMSVHEEKYGKIETFRPFHESPAAQLNYLLFFGLNKPVSDEEIRRIIDEINRSTGNPHFVEDFIKQLEKILKNYPLTVREAMKERIERIYSSLKRDLPPWENSEIPLNLFRYYMKKKKREIVV